MLMWEGRKEGKHQDPFLRWAGSYQQSVSRLSAEENDMNLGPATSTK